jgi:hypothetical protein
MMMMVYEKEAVLPEEPVFLCRCDSANGECTCLFSDDPPQKEQQKLMHLAQAQMAPKRGRQKDRRRPINRSRSLIYKKIN